MSTKLSEPFDEISADDIYVGNEETVSICSDSEHVATEDAAASESEEEYEEVRGQPAARGRSDSGALLDMLAEVASQKLLFSPLKRHDRRDSDGKSAHFKGLSNNALIQLFSKTEFDEMRKWYTYFCKFDEECTAKFVSFGSENRAKENFKQHLYKHMEDYTPKIEATAKVMKRRVSHNRVGRPRKVKPKPQIELEQLEDLSQAEIIADSGEEDDPISTEAWPGNFILQEPEQKQTGFFFDENIPKVEVEIVGQEGETSTSEISSAVVDLNGLIAGLSEKMGVTGEHSYSTGDGDGDSQQQQQLVFYVVDSDGLLRSPPVVPHQGDENEVEYSVIRSAELPVIANKRSMSPPAMSILSDPSAMWELNQGENIERDEFRLKRKPKGKAKFIGQSRAEKQQALDAIERIRMKRGGCGPDSLTCNICKPARTFTAPTTLISHYRSHAGIKPYECPVCSAVFTRQHSLNYHMLIHQNMTRFTCQDCGRKFRHPSHFREHRRRHTGESPFECSDCLMRFKTRNTYKRHLRTRHGKVLTTSGGLIILSEDEFQMVRTAPRTQTPGKKLRSKHQSDNDEGEIDAIDEDIQALHQLEIVTSNEGYEGYTKDEEIDMDVDMAADFLGEDGDSGPYKEIVKEAVRLERAEAQTSSSSFQQFIKNEEPMEETLVIETEDPLVGSGLFLATLEDGETVLVNTREDDSDDLTGRVDLGLKLCEIGKVKRNSQEPTVIVIKNESFS